MINDIQSFIVCAGWFIKGLSKAFSLPKIDAPMGADYRAFATKTPIGLKNICPQGIGRSLSHW
jgi:hypothetical protein